MFLGLSKKQDGRPGLSLAETVSTSPLKLLNGIQQNLTESKISKSSIKFLFFWLISKQKLLHWTIGHKGGTLYSGAPYWPFGPLVFNAWVSPRLMCTIVIMPCLSSIRHQWSLTFHIFDFFSETAEWNIQQT